MTDQLPPPPPNWEGEQIEENEPDPEDGLFSMSVKKAKKWNLEERKTILGTPGDHQGHAEVVDFLHGDRLAHNPALGWLWYNGTHWERDNADGRVIAAIVNTLDIRGQLANFHGVDALEKQCTRSSGRVTGIRTLLLGIEGIHQNEDLFDKHPDLLNVRNGVLDLRTGELQDHDPAYLFTYCLKIRYNPNADPFDWLEFLDTALEEKGNPGAGSEKLDFIQAAMGYTLTGHTRMEILFYIFGPPRSGKGTFTETMLRLAPTPLGVEVNFETFTEKRTADGQNFDLAPLKACRFVAASESSRWSQLNAAKVKQITGGGDVRCSFKHKDHFSYRPQYKIWLQSNFSANVDPEDKAAWGRLRVIEFQNSHLGSEDLTLKTRMRDQVVLEGILAWAVEGARAWYEAPQDSLRPPSSVLEATERARADLDMVAQWMSSHCRVAPDGWASSAELHQSYREWCEQEGIKPKGGPQFGKSLGLTGMVAELRDHAGRRRVRGYAGIELSPIQVTGSEPKKDDEITW